MEIRFWQTKSGREPVYEFMNEQPSDAFAKMAKSIDHFEEQGLKLLANSKRLAPLPPYRGLYELKIDFKGIFYRIIFCVSRGIAHFLVAFKKKDNRTRHGYIRTALERQATVAA
jgi:hypothetical protein